MIDTHAHIYLPEFDKDREQIISDARSNGVGKILMPAIDSSSHNIMFQVEKQFEDCTPMIGLHPCSVKENYIEELGIVKEHLGKRNFIAIGEIGLDFYWDISFKNQQHEAFEEQIQLAVLKEIPIVIHSRNSVDECIDIVKNFPGSTGVFHCFSGNEEQAKKILDLNFMLGIGGVVSFKNAGLDKVIEKIGINNVVLETDAPYLAPVPFRGKRNEPKYVKLVAEKLAAITRKTIKEIEEITTSNATRLFNLK
jgi:TatD DNase family protein